MLGGSLTLASGFSGIAFSGNQMLPTQDGFYKYVMWVSGTTYRAKNTWTGVVEYSGTDFVSDIMQPVLNAHSGTGVSIQLTDQTFNITTPIMIPAVNTQCFSINGVYGSRDIGSYS